MLRIISLSLGLLILVIALIGLSGRKYVPMATAATRTFHERFSAGKDDLILQSSEGRQNDSEREMFAQIRRKMGVCNYLLPQSWKVENNFKGTFVTVFSQAKCENGGMNERFIWHIASGSASLVSYRASSPVFLHH